MATASINNNDDDNQVVEVGNDVLVIVILSKLTTTLPATAADAAGGYDDHHNFCCASDSSSSAALNGMTVTMSNVFEWEGEGDGDSVQLILSSKATTMMASVLAPKTVANDSERGIDVRTLLEEVVAAGDGAKRTVLVHLYCQNCAAQGHSDDEARPVATE